MEEKGKGREEEGKKRKGEGCWLQWRRDGFMVLSGRLDGWAGGAVGGDGL